MTADGEGLASQAGLVWLGEGRGSTGLAPGLSAAMAERPQRRHDRGLTLAQMAVALADGATCESDLATLRDQPGLFGPVASHATAWRTIAGLAPAEYRLLSGARAQARAAVWVAGAGPAGDEAVIDLDATLVTTKADKQGRGGDLQAQLRAPPALGDVRRDRRGPLDHVAAGQRGSTTTRQASGSPSIASAALGASS